MVEENFGFWLSKMPKNNEGFEPLISECLPHGWRKFWILMISNAQEWRIWTIYLRMSSPWLKKILDLDDLTCPRMKDLTQSHLSPNIFTMVEESFWFWWSQMPKNEEFEPLFSKYLHQGRWKFWIYDLEFLRMKDLNHSSQTVFTMIEENFGFWWSEMPKNEGFKALITECLDHGWRKFWNLMISNDQE